MKWWLQYRQNYVHVHLHQKKTTKDSWLLCFMRKVAMFARFMLWSGVLWITVRWGCSSGLNTNWACTHWLGPVLGTATHTQVTCGGVFGVAWGSSRGRIQGCRTPRVYPCYLPWLLVVVVWFWWGVTSRVTGVSGGSGFRDWVQLRNVMLLCSWCSHTFVICHVPH